MAPPATRIGYRHADPRYPFLWASASQPAARWHGPGEGPAHYLADTPTGAWAEFLRHEGITHPDDLPGIRRALWAVEVPADAIAQAAQPQLPEPILNGPLDSHPACQAEARRLRHAGAQTLCAPSAALLPGGASGYSMAPATHPTHPGRQQPASPARHGQVWVLYGHWPQARGWPVVDAGAPPAEVLGWVRGL